MKTLALEGGSPVRPEPYPKWPVFDERDEQALMEVLSSGGWGGFPYPGPFTQAFQERFIQVLGGEHLLTQPAPKAVALTNGTLTMTVALQAAGIGTGDRVIVPAYSFAATATAPIMAGAVPVLADIHPDTWCLDPDAAAEAASDPSVKAIIPVHLGHQMADMDALLSLAEARGLVIIEDTAHAPGARWNDQPAGFIGDFGSFSLQSFKTLTTGEGGVLVCRTPESAYAAMSLIDCGRPHDPEGSGYTFGMNLRLPEFAANLGIVALERFPRQFEARAEMADLLEEMLSEVPGVRLLPRDPRHTARSLYKYSFVVDPEVFGVSRDGLLKALAAEGVPCSAGYPPMHRYDLFQPALSRLPAALEYMASIQGIKPQHLPVAEAASETTIWLPESVFRAGPVGVEAVAEALIKLLENKSALVRWFKQ